MSPYPIAVDAIALGAATLDWIPPTTNADDTLLTDLVGYRIYWGTEPGDYPNLVPVDPAVLLGAGLSAYTVENLPTNDTYYFVITAINVSGLQSDFSNMTQKAIP